MKLTRDELMPGDKITLIAEVVEAESYEKFPKAKLNGTHEMVLDFPLNISVDVERPEPKREPGWYPVKIGVHFFLRRWDGEDWLDECGRTTRFASNGHAWVGPRVEVPK